MRLRTRLVCVALGLVSFAAGIAVASDELTTADRDAIRSVHEAYRKAWLANDAEGVRRAFTQDAVLLPHHGVAPVVGMDAIKDFWWPANAPATTIDKFEVRLDEIGGDGKIGYVRGRSHVEWTVDEHGKLAKYANTGTFLGLMRKLPDGSWRISRLMWDDPENQRQ